ncbi:GW dipeptide domain-containing protein [Virgibacillus sp. W0181]|uniref:GW dipeptide domain-containing protein n=1 Tax=Virgibacillus sp. W0181 TaxID=3391581 RepID=UPI003F45FBF7
MRKFYIFTILLCLFNLLLSNEASAVDKTIDETNQELKSSEDEESIENDENKADFKNGSNPAQNNSTNKEVDTEETKESNAKEDITEESATHNENYNEKKSISKQESKDNNKEDQEVNEKKSNQSTKLTIKESDTNKLGRIKSSKATIYETIGENSTSFLAESKYTNKVFYIKKQAEINSQTYYLISTAASSTEGVVGWVKKKDVLVQSVETVDHKEKTYYLTGTGWAYTDAWGAGKDVVLDNLSKYKNNAFEINQTEKVGNSIWYQGTIEGKLLWVQANNVSKVNENTSSKMVSTSSKIINTTNKKETSTSKLGRIQNSQATIYKTIGDDSTSFQAGSQYTDKIFYIKKQAEINSQIYYSISTVASSTHGVIGWVKAEDMWAQNHVKVDHKEKTYYLKGTGWAYTDAWGAGKDVVFNDLSKYKNKAFEIKLTEKVGNAIWYRGIIDGKLLWVQAYNVVKPKESSTSKLGRIQSSQATIYKTIGDDSTSFQAGSQYTDKIFYIKKQAEINSQIYYLISTVASSTHGVVGWVKAEDMWAQNHVKVDHKEKTYYLKGTGWAYTDAWGASKDVVIKDLSKYKNKAFKIKLTEKVGNAIWYRGMINGQLLWVQAYNVAIPKESDTSKLGRIDGSEATIYKTIGDDSTSFQAGTEHTDKVFYIKKQVEINNQYYYLISTVASSTYGVVGWVNAEDMWAQDHVKVDHQEKTYYLKGSGWAYTDAWGAGQDVVIRNLSKYKNKQFKIKLTEKVGEAIWYRGIIDGQLLWVQAYNVNETTHIYTNYNLTLNKALDIQMKATPQTDKKYAWVSKNYISKDNRVDVKSVLNVRSGAGTSFGVIGQLSDGTKVEVLDEHDGWYAITYQHKQWVHASPKDVLYYLDPNNFLNDVKQQFQFLNISSYSGASAELLNKYLRGKGILAGEGQAFIDAGKLYGINDVYLMSHTFLETGNGSSTLAKGVKYKGKTVYNMYGTGAYDSCPIECGAAYAYEAGWTTPYKAIVGGAKFVHEKYVQSGLNTLYKMRWNPAVMDATGAFGSQYATDIGWASKQTHTMYKVYQEIGSYTLHLDTPVYR